MEDAIEILRLALDRSDGGKQDGPDVRLALRTLQFCGVPRDACKYFWSGATADNHIGRSQTMHAALNRIELFRQGKLKA